MLSENDGGFSAPTVSPALKELGHASFACIALVLRLHLGLTWAEALPEELQDIAKQMMEDYRLLFAFDDLPRGCLTITIAETICCQCCKPGSRH